MLLEQSWSASTFGGKEPAYAVGESLDFLNSFREESVYLLDNRTVFSAQPGPKKPTYAVGSHGLSEFLR